jgi:hypothetical protein
MAAGPVCVCQSPPHPESIPPSVPFRRRGAVQEGRNRSRPERQSAGPLVRRHFRGLDLISTHDRRRQLNRHRDQRRGVAVQRAMRLVGMPRAGGMLVMKNWYPYRHSPIWALFFSATSAMISGIDFRTSVAPLSAKCSMPSMSIFDHGRQREEVRQPIERYGGHWEGVPLSMGF